MRFQMAIMLFFILELAIFESSIVEGHELASLVRVSPNDYKIELTSQTNGTLIQMSCRAHLGGDHKYFHYYFLFSSHPQTHYFSPPKYPFYISCLYSSQGNFAAKVPIFDSRWPNAEDCRTNNGGCRLLIEDSAMYRVDSNGTKAIMGDLPFKHCMRILGIFSVNCYEIEHKNPLVGDIIDGWTYWWKFVLSL